VVIGGDRVGVGRREGAVMGVVVGGVHVSTLFVVGVDDIRATP
jgi:hypothetical protein